MDLQHPSLSDLEPVAAEAPPARRFRRPALLATALFAVVATLALALAHGADGRSAIDAGPALPGTQAPGDAGTGKTLGRGSDAEKVVGGPMAKRNASTTTAGTSTSGSRATGAGTGAAAAAVVAGGAPGASSAATASGATSGTASPGGTAPTTSAPRGTSSGGGVTTTTRGATPAPTPTSAPPTTSPPASAPPIASGPWTPTGPIYWLATDGTDGAAGSEGSPWRSFGYALSRLRAGDTLLVKAGTYGSFSATTIDAGGINGAPGAPITIAAAPGQSVTLRGGGWQVVYVANSSYVDIRGFEVVGNAPADRSDANGIEVVASHHVRIINNTVHDVGGGGIGTNRANHVTIDGNRVYNTSNWNAYQTSGISLFESANIGGGNNSDGFSFYVRNNVLWNNRTLVGVVSDGNCIIVDSNRHTGYTGATSITNNLCYANGGRGVHVFIADNVVATNNTLVGNLTSSQMFDSGELSAIQAGNVTFRNNLVIPGRDGNGTAEYLSSNITYVTNMFVGSAPAHRGSSDRIVGDARVGADYVPLAGSPAIDAGTAEGAPTTDRRGKARTGAPDIGCYEA